MIKIVILAAGKGTRMKSELPKVLVPFRGEPMIKRLLKSIEKSGIDNKPIIIVSPSNHEIIKKELQDFNCDYCIQKEQLGTGHAIMSAKDKIDKAERVIVFFGDHPFVKEDTVKKISEIHPDSVRMAVVEVDDFNEWRKVFYHWGRVIKENDDIKEIVEFKDAPEHIKEVKSINPSFYCFNAKWLVENIDKLKNDNSQKEYYLTDMVKIAFNEKRKVESFTIEAKQAIGINSVEEMILAESLHK